MRAFVIFAGRGYHNAPTVIANMKTAPMPVGAEYLAGCVGLFGGAIEEGESEIEALLREIKEETGNWFEEARMPGTSKKVFGLPATNGLAELTRTEKFVTYVAHVDVGKVSIRRLNRECNEGVAVTIDRDSIDNYTFVSKEIERAVEQALDLMGV